MQEHRKVAIIDYGLGNLRSVSGAVEKLGFEYVVTNKLADLSNAQSLILPGVGAFGEGMKNLHRLGLIDKLNYLIFEKRKPILGICLGFQLMAQESCEFGHHKGLGWLHASVEKLDICANLPLPHIGWNDLFHRKESKLLKGIPGNVLFFYVHSYHVCCIEDNIVIGECEYGTRFTAAIEKNNIFGTQFHPEKSQRWGLEILKNFLYSN